MALVVLVPQRRGRPFLVVIRATVLLLVVTVGTLLHVSPVRAAEPYARKVLFIGIDGVRSDVLKVAHTPYLDGLIKNGAFAYDTQILGERYRLNDTVSAPGWASILTGVWADKHGVNGSTFEGVNVAQYPTFLQRLKQARPSARTAAFVSWPSLAQQVIRTADLLTVFGPTPSSARALAADREVTEAARRHLLEGDPDALFVYWALPDVIGHERVFHRSVREYRRAVETVDSLAGTLLRAIWARKAFRREDWLVLVTSDHGGKGTHHRNGQHDPDVLTVFLIVSGPAARPGRIRSPTYIVDPAATALSHLGVELEAAWGLDGRVVGLKPR
jgi:predicted AlkP superfamily pyrophosphatase or phosphodiesterase